MSSGGASCLMDDSVAFASTPPPSSSEQRASIDGHGCNGGVNERQVRTSPVAGTEEDTAVPLSPSGRSLTHRLDTNVDNGCDPIMTDSGLLLTHRRTPASTSALSVDTAGRVRDVPGLAPERGWNAHRETFVRPSPMSHGGPAGGFGGGVGMGTGSICGGAGVGGVFARILPTYRFRSAATSFSLDDNVNGEEEGVEGRGSEALLVRRTRAWTATLLATLALFAGSAISTARYEWIDWRDERSRRRMRQPMAEMALGVAVGVEADAVVSGVGGEVSAPPDRRSLSSLTRGALDVGRAVQSAGGGGGAGAGAGAGVHGGRMHHGKHDEGVLQTLRSEFEAWADKHKRDYGSHDEKEKRFIIWADNHHKTIAKNEKHGPCKLTKKKVFGDNHFKDLTPEEFKSRFLTGYGGPRTDKLPEGHRHQRRTDEAMETRRRASFFSHTADVGADGAGNSNGRGQGQGQSRPTSDTSPDPITAADRHPTVQAKYEEHVRQSRESTGMSLADALQQKTYIDHWESNKYKTVSGCGYKKTYVKRERKKNQSSYDGYNNNYGTNNNQAMRNCYRMEQSTTQSSEGMQSNSGFSWYSCKWYDVSCWLRVIFTGNAYGGSSEPIFDESSYPSAFDWRDLGAVTDVHSQGQCGACWAITAVETIESAYFIKTGNLIDLAESEVIVCDSTCALCEGGWPQNAYDYVKKWNGLPQEQYWQYDDYWLLSLTYFAMGQSDGLGGDDVASYLTAQCPTGNWMLDGEQSGSGSNSHSGDNDWNYDSEYLSAARYGKIKDYAYATDRCICYTDGNGCGCGEQNEKRALMNLASYGPATVCLDASVWQDYEGGILTADSGCSSEFLDMNHCVQAVGYAFTDDDSNAEMDEQNSHSSHSGSRDDSDRVGYWIIRNQWSSNWGMNGYIYVAMGDNTCGVLNDMTQAFAS